MAQEISPEEFKLYRRLKQKKFRYQQRLFLVEGFRLLRELDISKWPTRCLLFEKDASKLAESFSWTPKIIKRGGVSLLSEVHSNQKIIGVAEIQDFPKPQFSYWKKILILEQISDPGNLGTILRSAAAFSVDAVFLSKNCTDPFNAKSLRASMGGIFHLPLYLNQELSSLLTILAAQNFEIIGTSPHVKTSLAAHTFNQKTALLLSNEAHGSALKKQISCWLSIPTPGLESLNVAQAASIFLYHMNLARPSKYKKK